MLFTADSSKIDTSIFDVPFDGIYINFHSVITIFKRGVSVNTFVFKKLKITTNTVKF